ncbi:MAG TPA: PAS domain S-box protein [Ideonella sp.]|uniref:PAS domain S-box protein n=1 Tax=Ideonella sp. TaxID=1929293 RepID=UPI002E36A11C|nr:PAS domain S-box protein [Ideonella sp.]HEX5684232.1 PAS domain S-box protein [Ideonella sp.]
MNRPSAPPFDPSPAEAGLGPTLSEIHRRTEARVAEALQRAGDPIGPGEVTQLIQELGEHQVSLERQNAQLRQTHAELEQSRDRYVDLYDRAPLGYVTLDLYDRIVEANHAAAALLGAPRARLLGQALQQFIRREDQLDFRLHIEAVGRGEGAGALELKLAPANGADGRWVALETTVAAAKPYEGPQRRVAMLDISERIRMQTGMARFAAIVSSSDDAIISRDLDGRITSWNDAARRLFGRTADEMLGRVMDELVPQELRAQEADLLCRLRHGQKVAHIESERHGANGGRVPVSMSLSPIHDEHGAVTGSALIARDISERRRADRALRERVRQLDVLSQASQSLILGEQDPATMRRELLERVQAAAGCEICVDYGVSEDGASLLLQSSIGLSDAQRVEMACVPVAESPCGLVVQRKSRIVIDDLQNSPFPKVQQLKQAGACSFVGLPLMAHGHVYGVAAFVSTSRDRFRGGDLLVMKGLCEQVSAMLERCQLIAELSNREQTLRKADRAKDEMIATLAHELRNPLAPLRNAVSILHHDLTDTRRVAWCRDIIERQVVQMSHLLEDLLDVSRLTRRKIELRIERLELRRVVAQAVEAVQPLIDEKRHQLRLDLSAQPIVVHADLTRLTQVLANLLSNAAKYSDPGSDIVLRAWRDGETACVSVRDNGIGIAAEQLPLIFDMFSQLSPALERTGGGLGIGLALARGLAEQHGGTLQARSEGRGLGSEFTLRLPMGEAAPKAEGAANASEAADPPRHRLLVVDDNVDAAQTLAAMLSLHGQDVRTAYGSLEALQLAEQWRPDVALLDIGMPELNGYELCRRLRDQRPSRPPLFIACTGWGQEADRERAHDAGFDFHLVKPVDVNSLLRLLGATDPQTAPRH